MGLVLALALAYVDTHLVSRPILAGGVDGGPALLLWWDDETYGPDQVLFARLVDPGALAPRSAPFALPMPPPLVAWDGEGWYLLAGNLHAVSTAGGVSSFQRGVPRASGMVPVAEGFLVVASPSEGRRVTVQLMGRAGSMLDDEVVLDSVDAVAQPFVFLGQPRIATNGRDALVVWSHGDVNQVAYRLVGPSGEPVAETRRTDPHTGGWPVVAANGKGFLVAWVDAEGALRALRVDAAGAPAGELLRVADRAASGDLRVVSDGEGTLVVWTELGGVHTRRVDGDGGLGPAHALPAPSTVDLDVAFVDGSLVAVWVAGDLVATRLTVDGAVVEGEPRVLAGPLPDEDHPGEPVPLGHCAVGLGATRVSLAPLLLLLALLLGLGGCAERRTTRTVFAPAGELIVDAWSAGPAEVWLAASGATAGHVYRWDGAEARREEAPALAGLFPAAVWGTGAGEVWIAGATVDRVGRLARWDGAAWSIAVEVPESNFGGVWGVSPSDVWATGFRAAGAGGAEWLPFALHLEDGAWRDVPVPPALFTFAPRVRGVARDAVWMQAERAGPNDPPVWWNGVSWGPPPAAMRRATLLWPVGGAIWGTASGEIVSFAGAGEPRVISTGDRDVVGLWGSGEDDVWIAGGRCEDRGIFGDCADYARFALHWDGGGLETVGYAREVQIDGVTGAGPGVAWFFGEELQVAERGRWSRMAG